jgi:hypothetical protein
MHSRTIDGRTFLAILAMSVSAACAGCLHDKVEAPAPVAAAPQPETERPMSVAPDTNALPPQPPAPSPPDVFGDPAPPPLSSMPNVQMPSAPSKPAAEHSPADRGSEAADHPPAPQISLQLSQADRQAYERRTTDDLNVTRANLQQANGKQLNASQRDLLEKARSFLQQSLDAGKAGDWVRAQNLAEKARVFSVELVGSL